MNALAHQVVSDPAPDLLVLASPDRAWCDQIKAAFVGAAPGLPPAIACVGDASGIVNSNCGNGVWLVEEAWLGDVLAAHPTSADGEPRLVVRLEHLCSEGVVSAIGAGAQGCLSRDAGEFEVLQAVRAVRAGELWLSRKLFAQVLAHLLAQVQLQNHVVVQRHEECDERMTERQREIAACVARGMSNKQIGRQLGISPTTVKTHLHNIFERVGVGGRTLLALRAMDAENR